MWMFLEGFYLHNLVVVTVFQSSLNYLVYYVVGWGESSSFSLFALLLVALSSSRQSLSYDDCITGKFTRTVLCCIIIVYHNTATHMSSSYS